MQEKQVDVAVGVLAERRDEGWRVLITRRPDTAVLGGYWEFPGGKREVNESMEECLRREFSEEIGVVVKVIEPLGIIEHQYPHASVRLHPYICHRVSGEPENLAVAEHRWIRPDELSEYTFPQANQGLITEVIERFARMS